MSPAKKPRKSLAKRPPKSQKTARAEVTAQLGLKARLGARVEFRIYPSIGIARVGDCKDSFIIGPEAPGIAPPGPFRGADMGLKPQAARFRIYRVDIDANENETVTKEIVPDDHIKLVWSVSLANRKAAALRIADTLARKPNPLYRNAGLDRDKLVISASGSVSGSAANALPLSGDIEFARPRKAGLVVKGIELATLRTDQKGRLLVVGGPGISASPLDSPLPSFSDNDGWYDSVSDGPVSATLHIDGEIQAVTPAWVVVTVPRYAPGTYSIITWYDQALNMARMTEDGLFDRPKTTSFTRDVFPILRRADNLSGVHGVAHSISAPALSDYPRKSGFDDAAARAIILKRLIPPGTEAPDAQALPPDGMPKLYSGANPDPTGPTWTYLALTNYQMAHIQNWVRGNFDADWPGAAPEPSSFEDIPVARQAWALTEAALEACVGGAFYPGIEGTYDMARKSTYHPESNLRREFRIDPTHSPGFLTEKMALPWQADFADCADFWWPSQRPDQVVTDGGEKLRWDRDVVGPRMDDHLNMVALWSQLGVVVFDEAAGKFVETERALGAAIA